MSDPASFSSGHVETMNFQNSQNALNQARSLPSATLPQAQGYPQIMAQPMFNPGIHMHRALMMQQFDIATIPNADVRPTSDRPGRPPTAPAWPSGVCPLPYSPGLA
eukprot:874679_1